MAKEKANPIVKTLYSLEEYAIIRKANPGLIAAFKLKGDTSPKSLDEWDVLLYEFSQRPLNE